MTRTGLLVGGVAARTGVSRKALRLYEGAGILLPARRTAAGYRVYEEDVLPLLAFVARARRLGFSLAEIKEIVAIRRSGRPPCAHVRALARRKIDALERTLDDLAVVRDRLVQIARSSASGQRSSVVCPHIEQEGQGGKPDGQREILTVPRVRRVPRP